MKKVLIILTALLLSTNIAFAQYDDYNSEQEEINAFVVKTLTKNRHNIAMRYIIDNHHVIDSLHAVNITNQYAYTFFTFFIVSHESAWVATEDALGKVDVSNKKDIAKKVTELILLAYCNCEEQHLEEMSKIRKEKSAQEKERKKYCENEINESIDLLFSYLFSSAITQIVGTDEVKAYDVFVNTISQSSCPTQAAKDILSRKVLLNIIRQ